MEFQSVLYQNADDRPSEETHEQPSCFIDLNLDQVVSAATAGREFYNLKPFYYSPLSSVESIRYRQEVMRDLEDWRLMGHIKAFSQGMAAVHRELTLVEKLDFPKHKQGWFLQAALSYCDAVSQLEHNLHAAQLYSRGLLALREYVSGYVQSDAFGRLERETRALKADLAKIRYGVIIDGSTVRVRAYQEEADYSSEVLNTFERFKQADTKDYRSKVYRHSGMDHVEAQILEFVSKLNPEMFQRLDQYCSVHAGFVDDTLHNFDREVQFYVSYLEYVDGLKKADLHLCYPELSTESKETHASDTYDLALAHKRVMQNLPIVPNELQLGGAERIIVLTGPNQGGKTTFARTFGQLHYLARLGCPVPGRNAHLFVCDQILTHFEKQESVENLRGKLEDDLVRIHDILEGATCSSVVVLNEILTSTTLEDAVTLSKRILDRIIAHDCLCVFVTFIDELASLHESIVSAVSTVDPANPTLRTFRIVRKPANGLAYALSIAEKYHLRHDQILERLQP